MTRFRTLRVRLTLQWVLVFSLILVLFSLGVYVGLRALLYRHLDAALWSIAESEIASATDAPDGMLHVHDVAPHARRFRRGSHLEKLVQLRTFPEGRLVDKSHNLGVTELPLSPQAHSHLSRGAVLLETVQAPGTPPIRLISLPVVVQGHVRYAMQVGTSLAPLHDTMAWLRWLLLIMDASALVLTSTAGMVLAYRVLRPVERLTRTIERIASQNLDQRLPIPHPEDEIGRLSRVLNRMLTRLERSFHSQQRFIADASHELRSPLANLQLTLELALRRPRPPEDYRQALQQALEEVERLTRLVNDLLTLSRADSGRLEVLQQPVPLRPLLDRLLRTYRLQAKEKYVTLTCSVPDVVVRGDETRLRQLFANLLDNALRYTPAQGSVSLTGTLQDGHVRIAVVDTGPGIAPDHLPHLFERFYRGHPDRHRAEGGSGLGLALCQEIVRAHGGSLTASSTPAQGSTFTVTLPLDASTPPT